MFQTAYSDSAIVELGKENVKPVTLSATLAAWIELVHRQNLSLSPVTNATHSF